MSVPSKESLINDLQGLGIRAGDTAYFKVDLSVVSPSPKTYSIFFEAALELVGSEGTIVCPTFTRAGHPSLMDKSKPFDLTTPSHSGGWLARMFLNHPDVVRSAHPVNSFAAIGKHAEYICAEHDETRPGCWPTSRMMDLDAKQPIIGCVDSNPGFCYRTLGPVPAGPSVAHAKEGRLRGLLQEGRRGQAVCRGPPRRV